MSKVDSKVNPYIDEQAIWDLIETSKNLDINKIIEKAKKAKGLTLEESAALLNIDQDEILEVLFKTAKEVKELIYGTRIVLFAPLYLSNYCTNNCLYCGFRRDNKGLARVKLSIDQAVEEAKNLMTQGHKRLLLVAGEDVEQSNLDYLEEAVKRIYEAKVASGEIRRLNINIAPLSVEDFKRIKTFKIGTYQCFQETYHYETYKKMHPTGLKSNYAWRYETMGRAFEAGLDDVGMGVLFGLTDYKFEVLAMLYHCQELEEKYGVGPHTLSIPRLEPAKGAPFSEKSPYAVDDLSFKKIVAVLRLAVPYTGIILSTRERAEFRKEVIALGVSQISAGSKTNPGGYTVHGKSGEQFAVGDHRTLDEVIKELCEYDYIPSFCTGCYRLGRVGHDFMDLAKPGLIHKYCQPNALFTFTEYLLDYASDETKRIGMDAVERQIGIVEDEKFRKKIEDNINKIKHGERDVYF
ncbi:MAG: [FeFe] hydrogenase H-cluster radical SAM maturase HydG [Cyanobacteriota bacterium]